MTGRLDEVNVLKYFGSLMIVGVLATSAMAAPLPASPSPVPSAGESDLNSFTIPGLSDVTVDWMVLPSGPNFLYLYQIENTSGVGVTGFTVSVGATLLGFGILPGDNLDLVTGFHPSHTAPAPFPVLAGEEEGFAFAPLAAVLTTWTPGSDVTWTFAPLPAGSQSDTLFFISRLPPDYGLAVASDTTPPSPWGSLAPPPTDPVPVPAPEPGTLVLLGSGLIGVATWAGRRRHTR